MRYAHIIARIAGTPWAMHPAKADAMLGFIAAQARGEKWSPDEVSARIGRQSRHLLAYDDEETPAERSARIKAAEDNAIAERGGVAVIGLKGVIAPRLSDEMDVSGPGGTSAEGFSRRLRAALNDPRVGGVVIDVDSPGGAVFGVPEAAAAMLAARGGKPIVAVANPFTASAAYWIASAADEIAITPSGEIGSVGVYAYHEDLSQALDKAGVKPTLVKAAMSPDKADTHPAFPMSDDARAALQASVDRYGAWFINDVAVARGLAPDVVVAKFGRGRMVGAADAVAAGMADRIATLDQEIARMAERLAASPSKPGRASQMARRRLALA